MLPLTLTLIHLGPQAGPLNVGALLVRGTLVWDDTTQAGAAEQWLCAGYVAVEQHVVEVPPLWQ